MTPSVQRATDLDTRIPSGGVRILLARHGESEANLHGWMAGQLDVVLTSQGYHEARLLANALQHEPIDAIVSSSLQRAQQTAAPLADHLGLSVRSSPALNEMNLGILQGQSRGDNDSPDARIWHRFTAAVTSYRIPGGETVQEVLSRVSSCLDELQTEFAGKTVMVVGHRNTNRVILAYLMDWKIEDAWRMNPKASVVYDIRLGRPGQARLLTKIRVETRLP